MSLRCLRGRIVNEQIHIVRGAKYRVDLFNETEKDILFYEMVPQKDKLVWV